MSENDDTKPPSNIPLRLLRPLKVRKASGINGVLWSFRSNLPPALLLDWEGEQYAIYLGGRYPMRYFPIKADVSLSGVVAQGGEFLVDVNSRYDATQRPDPLGALVLRGGKAFLTGTSVGDTFADTASIPLWGNFNGDDEDVAVGFARWSLITRNGDDVFELWRQESQDAS